MAARELVLGFEQDAFGIEHGQEIGRAIFEALAGKAGRDFTRFDGFIQKIVPFLLPAELDERVLGLFQGNEDDLFIVGEAGFGPSVGGANAGADVSIVQSGPGNAGSKGKGIGTSRTQARESGRFESNVAIESHSREKIGHGHADVRSAGRKPAFGDADIRAAAEQCFGRADRNESGHRRKRFGGFQLIYQGRGFFAKENGQAVDGAGGETFEAWNGGQRGIELSAGAGDVEFCAPAAIEAGLSDFESFLLVAGIASSHGEFILRATEFEVVAGDFADEADQDIAAAGFRRIEGRAGSLDRAANPAEDIEFPGGVETDVVKFAGAVHARKTVEGGPAKPGVGVAGDAIDGGQEIELRVPVESTGLAQGGGGDAKVEIVSDRAGNEVFEFWIVESAPPGDGGIVGGKAGLSGVAERGGGLVFLGAIVWADGATGEGEDCEEGKTDKG